MILLVPSLSYCCAVHREPLAVTAVGAVYQAVLCALHTIQHNPHRARKKQKTECSEAFFLPRKNDLATFNWLDWTDPVVYT